MRGGILGAILGTPAHPDPPAPYQPEAEAVCRAMDTLWRELMRGQPNEPDWTRPFMIYTQRTRVSRMWRGKRFVYQTGLVIGLKQLTREQFTLR